MPNSRQAIIWTNDGLVYWHKYASLGLSELNPNCWNVLVKYKIWFILMKIIVAYPGSWNPPTGTNNGGFFDDAKSWLFHHWSSGGAPS